MFLVALPMGLETKSRTKLCACAVIPSRPPNLLLSPQTRKNSCHVKLQTVTSYLAQKGRKSAHCWTEGEVSQKAVEACFYSLTSGTVCLIRINTPSSWSGRGAGTVSLIQGLKRGSSLLNSLLSPTQHLFALVKSTHHL